VSFILLIIIYAAVSAAGLTLLKTSFTETSVHWSSFTNLLHDIAHLMQNYKFIIGIVLYLGGFVLWLKILIERPLSYAFPIASGALYVAIISVAYLFVGESISSVRVIGIVLIISGIILVGRTL
jgi:multidrug transporter EmrE-like cation transporter